MSASVIEFANLVLRQATDPAAILDITAADVPPPCGGGNTYDGRLGLRISSVFVILVGSTLGKSSSFSSDLIRTKTNQNIAPGALFPIIATRHPRLRVPGWAFMFTKYFGSGVIIATAFIHVRNSIHYSHHSN